MQNRLETAEANPPIATLAVVWANRDGVVDCTEAGEPFAHASGVVLAVRCADGTWIRSGMGRSKAYSASVDQVLEVMGLQR